MDKQDIIRMAQECHLIGMRPHLDGIYEESLERFAALVAAAEKNRLADAIEKMPFGDTASSFATFVRNFK